MADSFKEIKERLDRCEAALEAAGYMTWDEKTGKFKAVGVADEPNAEPESSEPE